MFSVRCQQILTTVQASSRGLPAAFGNTLATGTGRVVSYPARVLDIFWWCSRRIINLSNPTPHHSEAKFHIWISETVRLKKVHALVAWKLKIRSPSLITGTWVPYVPPTSSTVVDCYREHPNAPCFRWWGEIIVTNDATTTALLLNNRSHFTVSSHQN